MKLKILLFVVFAAGIGASYALAGDGKHHDSNGCQKVHLSGTIAPQTLTVAVDKAGEQFGFPWYGGGHTRTNEFKAETPPADVVFPEVEQVAHAADLGLSFYTGDQFPAKYKAAIFSTQHGSWNRTVPVGARVMVTFLKDDGHVAGP